MNSQLVAALPDEQLAVTHFLRNIFKGPANVNSFDPEVLAWKYFSQHPDWSSPRSYVVKNNQAIVAHAGIWPLTMRAGSKEFSVIHLIDWAASRSHPGAGILLLRKFSTMGDLLLTIGGSSDTQTILPRLGYRLCGELKLQAKLVKPLRQLARDHKLHWKTPLRLARNAVWSLSPLPKPPLGWAAKPVLQFDESISPFLVPESKSDLISRRSVAGLNYFLSCPGARFSGYVISKSGDIRGYFVLSQFYGQTRIVELRTQDNQESQHAGCVLAAQTAAELPETLEIVTGFSCQDQQREFGSMGFALRRVSPVFCYDPRKVLGQDAKVCVSMLDGDLCFFGNRENPYLS